MKTSREFIVDRKTLRSWVANQASIRDTSMKSKRARRAYTGTKRPYEEMERELIAWIIENRNRGVCIGGKDIRFKALSILKTKNQDNFLASKGWLMKFLAHNRLSLRRITSVGAAKPKNLGQTVNNFIVDCESNFSGVSRNEIFNMDETAVYLDFPRKLNSF
jgi:hypothetical protein